MTGPVIERFSWRRGEVFPEWAQLADPAPVLGGNYVHSFLSNFYPAKVVWEGFEYPTVEHAYQAAKTRDPAEREAIETCITAGAAKQLGRKATLRPGWDDTKESVMALLLLQKFMLHDDLRLALLDTEPAVLIEGNDWHDYYWGAVLRDGTWHGANRLGSLLHRTRAALQRTGR